MLWSVPCKLDVVSILFYFFFHWISRFLFFLFVFCWNSCVCIFYSCCYSSFFIHCFLDQMLHLTVLATLSIGCSSILTFYYVLLFEIANEPIIYTVHVDALMIDNKVFVVALDDFCYTHFVYKMWYSFRVALFCFLFLFFYFSSFHLYSLYKYVCLCIMLMLIFARYFQSAIDIKYLCFIYSCSLIFG